MICGKLIAAGLHLASWHSMDAYNDVNPGAYVRCESGVQFGAFYNSERRASPYAAYVWEAERVPAFAAVGLATGYGPPVSPMVMAGVKIGPFRVGYIPKFGKYNPPHTLHVMLEIRIGQRQ